MAHQDVVPIAPGTEGDWQPPPFAGAHQGRLRLGPRRVGRQGQPDVASWRRSRCCVAAGFQPRQTIYLVFGQDEEVGGERGARQIAQLLKERGVRLRFVLDEGLLITEGVARRASTSRRR